MATAALGLLSGNCARASGTEAVLKINIWLEQVSKGGRCLSFYTLPEYENWKETVNQKGWAVKYYKGLGTSTKEEAKAYFADIHQHRKEFIYEGGYLSPASFTFTNPFRSNCLGFT